MSTRNLNTNNDALELSDRHTLTIYFAGVERGEWVTLAMATLQSDTESARVINFLTGGYYKRVVIYGLAPAP